MKKRTILKILLLAFIATSIGTACSREPRVSVVDIEPDFMGTGWIFLYSIAYDDNDTAMSVLSPDAQLAVEEYCDSGEVINCFSNTNYQNWESISFKPSYSQGTTAFYQIIQWHDETIVVVLEIVKVNGEWRVNSWRGLIPVETLDDWNNLANGRIAPNRFPPE